MEAVNWSRQSRFSILELPYIFHFFPVNLKILYPKQLAPNNVYRKATLLFEVYSLNLAAHPQLYFY